MDLNLKDWFVEVCAPLRLTGTILLAREGVNGSVEGENTSIERFAQILREHPLFADMLLKKSASPGNAFKRLRIKVKKEMLTFGKPELKPEVKTGQFVPPEEWNTLIQTQDVVLIDTRNFYEWDLGHFPGAVNPHTRSFKQFPDFIEKNKKQFEGKKIALYCTGGIRCEKASAYLLQSGFEDVYQLQGGILHYLEKIPAHDNVWQGECMVFDDRLSLNKNLEKGSLNQALPIEG